MLLNSKRRGRPREVADPVRVSVRISAPDYDRLDRLAREQGRSVPAIIRDRLSAPENRQPPSPSAHSS